MEGTTEDRRVTRTKEAILKALISLIEEKGFEAVSVSDITSRANINRGTFYLHYQDKYDLLEKTESEIIQDFKQIVLHTNNLTISDIKNTTDILPLVITFFEYLKDHAALLHAILGIKGDISFQTQMKKTIENNLFKIGFFLGIKVENLLVPREYLISYISSAHLGVIQTWLVNGCRETPQEMASILSRLSLQGPISAIGIRWIHTSE